MRLMGRKIFRLGWTSIPMVLLLHLTEILHTFDPNSRMLRGDLKFVKSLTRGRSRRLCSAMLFAEIAGEITRRSAPLFARTNTQLTHKKSLR